MPLLQIVIVSTRPTRKGPAVAAWFEQQARAFEGFDIEMVDLAEAAIRCACDADGSVCTENDACSGGTCKAGSAKVCNDNNPCTSDSCDASAGCVFAPNTAACDADGSIWARFGVPWQPAYVFEGSDGTSTLVNNPTSAMSQQELTDRVRALTA